jgi:hypothetical protein
MTSLSRFSGAAQFNNNSLRLARISSCICDSRDGNPITNVCRSTSNNNYEMDKEAIRKKDKAKNFNYIEPSDTFGNNQ